MGANKFRRGFKGRIMLALYRDGFTADEIAEATGSTIENIRVWASQNGHSFRERTAFVSNRVPLRVPPHIAGQIRETGVLPEGVRV